MRKDYHAIEQVFDATDPLVCGPALLWDTIEDMTNLQASSLDSSSPPALLRIMLACFATGNVEGVHDAVSTHYYDHQSSEQPQPHGPDLFCAVVAGARASLPELRLEIDALETLGPDLAQSRTRWHWTDGGGARRVRTTVDRIRVKSGQVVEHWGHEVER